MDSSQSSGTEMQIAGTLRPRWTSVLQQLASQDTSDPSNMAEIDGLIRDTELHRSNNATIMNQLQADYQRLQAEDTQLLQNLTQYRWHKSLLRTFPTELFSRIFRSILESSEGFAEGAVRLEDQVVCELLSVSHVCSRWRAVIRSNPEFWSTIRWAPRRSLSERQGLARLELLEMSLKLSKPLPLEIRFEARELPAHFAERALAVVCKHSERWNKMALAWAIPPVFSPYRQFWPDYDVLQVLRSVAKRLPQLKELFVEFKPAEEWMEHTQTITAFWEAPKVVRAILMPYFPAPCQWKQLEQLDIGDWDYQQLKVALTPASYLTSLTVADFLERPEGDRQRIYNSTITELVILARLDPGWHTIFFFDYVNFPNLKNLEIRLGRHPGELRRLDPITNFIDASRCSIECLTLDGLDVTGPGGLKLLFRALPSLKTLRFWETHPRKFLTDGILNILNVKLSSDIILPELTTLSVRVPVAATHFPRAAFVDAVISRSPIVDEAEAPSVTRLRTVDVMMDLDVETGVSESEEGVQTLLTLEDIDLLEKHVEDFAIF